MEFQSRKEAGATIVTVTGRLDAVTTPDYEKRVRELIEGHFEDGMVGKINVTQR